MPDFPSAKPAADLTEAEAAEELTWLADTMAAYDIAYYQDDAPKVSDAEYEEAELADGHEPTVVHVNSRNEVTELVEDMVPVMWEVE